MRSQNWTAEEDQQLCALITAYGKDWSFISGRITGRSAKACSQRWLKVQKLKQTAPVATAEAETVVPQRRTHVERVNAPSNVTEDGASDDGNSIASDEDVPAPRSTPKATARNLKRSTPDPSSASSSLRLQAPIEVSNPRSAKRQAVDTGTRTRASTSASPKGHGMDWHSQDGERSLYIDPQALIVTQQAAARAIVQPVVQPNRHAIAIGQPESVPVVEAQPLQPLHRAPPRPQVDLAPQAAPRHDRRPHFPPPPPPPASSPRIARQQQQFTPPPSAAPHPPDHHRSDSDPAMVAVLCENQRLHAENAQLKDALQTAREQALIFRTQRDSAMAQHESMKEANYRLIDTLGTAANLRHGGHGHGML